MAGEVSKQDQALTRAASMVSDARTELSGSLQSLRGKLDGIGAQWKGAGAGAFTQVMQNWNEDARKIISSLERFEENLRKSESTYTAADEAQQSTFAKLSSRLS